MKRPIDENQYKEIVASNPNALDYSQLLSRGVIISETKFWVIAKNDFPYLEYDGREVLESMMVIPKRDDVYQFWELQDLEVADLKYALSTAFDLLSSKQGDDYLQVISLWKIVGKSIKKLHLHILCLGDLFEEITPR